MSGIKEEIVPEDAEGEPVTSDAYGGMGAAAEGEGNDEEEEEEVEQQEETSHERVTSDAYSVAASEQVAELAGWLAGEGEEQEVEGQAEADGDGEGLWEEEDLFGVVEEEEQEVEGQEAQEAEPGLQPRGSVADALPKTRPLGKSKDKGKGTGKDKKGKDKGTGASGSHLLVGKAVQRTIVKLKPEQPAGPPPGWTGPLMSQTLRAFPTVGSHVVRDGLIVGTVMVVLMVTS